MHLVTPQKHFLKSYVSFCVEYKKHGLSDFSITSKTIAELEALLSDDARLTASAEEILDELERLRAPAKKVQTPATAFWLVDGDEVMAIGNVRHYLSPALELFGGHIGYGVRLGHWNCGVGTEILRRMLPQAAGFGIKYALLTCEENNTASRRVMEKNGGILADTSRQNINGNERTAHRLLIDTGLMLNRPMLPVSAELNQAVGGTGLMLIPIKTISEGDRIFSHYFQIVTPSADVGRLVFRRADEPWLYLDGNLGYFIDPQYRRQGLASAACMLFLNHLKSIGQRQVFITCDPDNKATRKICQGPLDARLLEIAPYKFGTDIKIKCRYLC